MLLLYACPHVFQKSTYCIQDEACLRPIKWCNKEKYIVYGHCEFAVRSTRYVKGIRITFHVFQIWFWVALACLILVIFGSAISTVLCFFCSCCRKASQRQIFSAFYTNRQSFRIAICVGEQSPNQSIYTQRIIMEIGASTGLK